MKHIFNIPEWEEKYNLGIPEIDLQHQYFLKLIHRIYEKIDTEMPEELITSHLEEIFYYARFHFCSEENLMKLCNYPEYNHMKKIHDHLINELSNKITLCKIKKMDIEGLISFMVEWFNQHTTKEDRKMADYMKTIPDFILNKF